MMKITTCNLKSPDYTVNHEIFVGTKTGSIKSKLSYLQFFRSIVSSLHSIPELITGAENPYAQTNLQELRLLSKGSEITSMDWGAKDYSQLVVGRDDQHLNIFDINTNMFTSTHELTQKPVGVAIYNDRLHVGCANGELHTPTVKKSVPINAGDHMNRMRQCPFKDNLVATGGKGRKNNLKVWDLEKGVCEFTTKNVPNDMLSLEVPVWDSDVGFVDTNCMATCSRHGYIRFYDRRTQRRPVKEFRSKEQTAFTAMCLHDMSAYVGVATGSMLAFDLRSLKHSLHKYKGFTGSVADVTTDVTGKYVFTASLDRFVRGHEATSTELVYQCYVKSKAARILVRDGIIKEEVIEEEGEGENDETVEILDESNKNGLSDASDEEYDDMFDRMQKIR